MTTVVCFSVKERWVLGQIKEEDNCPIMFHPFSMTAINEHGWPVPAIKPILACKERGADRQDTYHYKYKVFVKNDF